jgi:phage integrase|nr:MAG TPA: Integrase [Caudoviricetes sp.]
MYFQTGCRRGELLAVTFADIDFYNKALHIYKNIARGRVKGGYGEIVTEPKTKGSVRDIPLSDDVLARIAKIKHDKNLPNDAFVFSFHENHSRWIAIDAVTQTFGKIREKANLPKELTLHSTRHTFASTLLTKGVDYATVAELGGWSSAAVLMAIYAHSNNAKKQEVMRRFMFDE